MPFPIVSEVHWWFTKAPKLSWVLVLYIRTNFYYSQIFLSFILFANKHQLTYISTMFSMTKVTPFFFFFAFQHVKTEKCDARGCTDWCCDVGSEQP